MIISITSFLSVFIGGGIGATLRWLISILANFFNLNAWIGTLFANIIGCFCIFLFVKIYGKDVNNMSLFLKVGILGGLTTFSGFALEAFTSIHQGRLLEAFLILSLNVLLGIVIGFAVLR